MEESIPSNAKALRGSYPPHLEQHQYAVIQAEHWTGIILKLDGERRRSDSDDKWILVFESFDAAKLFVEKRLKELPYVECVIRNTDGSFVEVFYSKDAIRKPIVMPE